MNFPMYKGGSYILEKEGRSLNALKRTWEYLTGVTVARSHINRIKPEFIANLSGDILDIGGFDDFFKERYEKGRYLNLDINDGPCIDLVQDAEQMSSVGDETFSAVICISVLEHTLHPTLILEEMRRVLKPGGLALLSTPWLFEAHMEPQDYWRFSNHFFSVDPNFEIQLIESSNGYLGLLAHFCQHNIFLRYTIGVVFLVCDLFLGKKYKWATQITCVLKKVDRA